MEVKKRGYLWSANLSPYFRCKECIIAQIEPNSKPFYLHFQVNGNGTEWIDADLPTPNYFYRPSVASGLSMESYCVAYLIEGYFKTTTNQAYLNDIIARMLLTLPIKERFKHAPKDEHKQINTLYSLKDFKALKSLTKQSVPKLRGNTADNDVKFWEIKLFIEYRIRDNGGEGSYVEFQTVFDHALHWYEWKDTSTCRAKIRNIWTWYYNRDWKFHLLKKNTQKTEEEILMTRQERARANAVKKSKEAKAKVINAVTGLYADEYKKKSGSWNITKIAEDLKMSRDTVSKHLKEWEHNKGGLFEE